MMKQELSKTSGYTLVELLVAIALTGILFTVTWVMFATSSDLLGEVDSLSHSSDRIRFAMERIRSDMQSAGALATADSTQDAWVQPKDSTWLVNGLYPYSGWQNDRSIFPSSEMSDANPNVSFDGIVMLGAYDNPLGFEIGNIPVSLASGTIAANSRGLHKLHVPDPFRTSPSYSIDFSTAAHIEPISHQWSTRIMRIMDPAGYMQFVKIGSEMTAGDLTTTGSGLNAVRVNFNPADHPPKTKAGTPFGLDLSAESDRSYEASVLDVFWYHVRQDPNDDTNFQLVRERLCGPAVVAAAASDYASWDPSSLTLPNGECPGGVSEVVIISDNVVDFQVWFDCATAYGQPLSGASWNIDWLTPDNSGTCMDPVGSVETGRARVAHIRMTVRADSERPNLAHIQFEDRAGNTCDPENPTTCDPVAFPGGRLQTFDVVPGLEGATPVITLQSTVALPNFSYR